MKFTWGVQNKCANFRATLYIVLLWIIIIVFHFLALLSLKYVLVQELQTGSIMNFIMSTEGCLGPLTFLRIWHDNTGHGKLKSWFLDQIQVTDLQTGEKYENSVCYFAV